GRPCRLHRGGGDGPAARHLSRGGRCPRRGGRGPGAAKGATDPRRVPAGTPQRKVRRTGPFPLALHREAATIRGGGPRERRRPFRRALRWRVLLLWWAALAVSGAIAVAPVFAFLRGQLDRSTAARDAVAWMDGPTLLELVRHVRESGAEQGILVALAVALAT